ncbi:hypothetical protein KC318_g17134 [Hortaea werneckii]|nr:hypothetical protein KC334_g17045 [Hortaea werneckii]KAI7649501.1 hypothetical protein KC318_g17134 [Hortaea werneckii]
MCLIDTFDGAAMMSLYTSARLAKDIIAVLYYQIVLTAVTVAVALAIGVLQLLTMIASIKPSLSGPFWDGVGVAGDHYEIIGGSICGAFVVFGVLSVLLYKPWRRRIDHKRSAIALPDDEDANVAAHGNVEVIDESNQTFNDSKHLHGKNEAVQTTANIHGSPAGPSG